jgi:HAD superfamily hydrolase (TIGR01509 family)
MGSDRSVHAVIFDMDGVLTDSEPLISAAAVAMFREQDLAVTPEDFHPFVGMGENRYLGGVAEKYGRLLDIPMAKKRTYEIYLELVPTRLNAFPGAVELVRACRKAGLRVAVASSADWIKIEANLRKIGLPPELWDAIVTGDDVEHKKPAPDIFLAAAQRLGLAPSECVVIEDAVNGVQSAKSAGMRCVAVAQTFRAEALQEADLVKPSIGDLKLEELAAPEDAPPLPPRSSSESLPAPRSFPREGTGRPWGLGATLGFSLVIVGAALAVWKGVGVLLPRAAGVAGSEGLVRGAREGGGLFLALATCVATPATVALVASFAWLRRDLSVKDYLALRRVRGRNLARWLVLLLCFCVVSDLVTWFMGRPLVPEVMVGQYRSAVFPPLFWLAVVVGAPLAEELFFRGFVFKGLLHSFLGGTGAVLVTAGMWASIHLQYDWYGTTILFLTGLLLGYARLKTNSVYPSLLMHALMNLLATVQVIVMVRTGQG